MVSGSLKERLQELVEAQQRQHKDGDLTADLIQSKVKLAETEFSALQLQVTAFKLLELPLPGGHMAGESEGIKHPRMGRW